MTRAADGADGLWMPGPQMAQMVIDLEFDTATGEAPLGDIASSLVAIDELLRDLATVADAEIAYRDIRVAAITMRNPLKVKLSLLAIPPQAVKAFQEICRDIIRFREGHPHQRDSVSREASIETALTLCTGPGEQARITVPERERMSAHIATLETAEVRLRRVRIDP